ncbi:MAG TPA: sigma-70 family RNA polymerase sigma factor [Clostridia bacterium]|nr:sigma-70 family RNA polymerase sigma factor [Clostridia bacterium]
MVLYTFDEAYVQGLKAGDPAAQQHFVNYFSELLVIKLRARFLSHDLIEDVRQETFVRVLAILKKDRGIDHPERLGAFVNSVCNNVLLEQYRANARTESLEDGDDPPDKTIDLDRKLVSDEAKRMVEQILDGLAERDRRVLRAVFLEEQSKDQVCKDFGVDRDYLRVLLHRAKTQFRAKYAQAGLPSFFASK